MNRFRKFYVAATAAILASVAALWDGALTQDEAIMLASTWLGAFGVLLFPNEPTDETVAAHPARDANGRFASQKGHVDTALVTAVAVVAIAVAIVLWALGYVPVD